MFYLNETESKRPHHLQMAGCQDSCTVGQFVSFIAPLAISRDEYENECKLGGLNDGFWSATLVVQVAAVIAGIVLVTGGSIVLGKCQLRNKPQSKVNLIIV